MVCRAGVAHNIEQHQRDPGLLGSQPAGVVHEFLHHRQLPD